MSERSLSSPITCLTRGHPPATSYRWTLNTSAGLEEMSRQRSSSLDLGKEKFRLSEDRKQIGEVKCWAANRLGESTEPCVFQLVAAGQSSFSY